jgi:hypothetical protein
MSGWSPTHNKLATNSEQLFSSGAADARLLPHRVVSSMFAAPPYFIGNHYVTLIDVQAVAK